jgi:hypothetical protein
MSHKDQPSGPHPQATPTFSRLDHAPGSAKGHSKTATSGSREWLRKISRGESSSVQLAREHMQLAQIRRLVRSMLGAHLVGMSSRDLKLYLRVISASRLATVREMRFECFDLMCRKISEPVAVRKLQEMDALLC